MLKTMRQQCIPVPFMKQNFMYVHLTVMIRPHQDSSIYHFKLQLHLDSQESALTIRIIMNSQIV